jgi:putative membrane protein insertion efficiency factor
MCRACLAARPAPSPFIGRVPGLIGIGLIKAYRYTLSPLMGQQCRYLPTCSSYAEEAVRRHGLWAGTWMFIARFQRCGPNGASGFDPVPETLNPAARWFLPWRYGYWTGAHIARSTRLDLPD